MSQEATLQTEDSPPPPEPSTTQASPRRPLGDWGPRHLFGIDLRSLAFLRIAYALIILGDVITRGRDLVAHYTDFGVLPRHAFHEIFSSPGWISIHLANGTWQFIAVLFLVQALLAVALLVGYRTKLVTVLLWMMVISVQTRNPMVLNGGDVYLRCVLFWCIFLPWEAVWSLDSVMTRRFEKIPYRYFSVATACLLLQIAFVYWFAAIPKSDPMWRTDYTATEVALQLDQFATPVAHWLLQYPEQLKFLTWLVISFEEIGPFLLFLPYTRAVAALGLAGLHFGFMSAMHLGFFGYIGVCSTLAMMPGGFWPRRFENRVQSLYERLARWLFPEHLRPAKENTWALGAWGFPLCLLFIYLFNWNLVNENCKPQYKYNSRQEVLAQLFRMDQRWNMFSPKPLDENGWYIIRGKRRSGDEVDLLTMRTPTMEKPADVSKTYRNQRWRKYLMNLWSRDHEKHRLFYGQYLCRSRNRAWVVFQDQIVEFKMTYMFSKIVPGEPQGPVNPTVIWHHYCYEVPSAPTPTPMPETTPTPIAR